MTDSSLLTGLHGLELADNPWACDCRLRPLKEWLVRQNVPFAAEPVCATPARLSRRGFDSLDVNEFACPPKIISAAPRYVEAKAGEGNGDARR